ncbi:hypothetical protein EYF80_024351 [Liparis tanakae]|uniref:Uncharacterized protein n=1 Tax=Liparis tanakae TaxID=230148 RepID=A0A4Z2HIK0_9TELE|nr:hypothetical protein EYF80_024351 [Liparis tanakae]
MMCDRCGLEQWFPTGLGQWFPTVVYILFIYLARSKKESVVSLSLRTLSSPRLRDPAPTPGLMMKARETPIPEAISVVTRK